MCEKISRIPGYSKKLNCSSKNRNITVSSRLKFRLKKCFYMKNLNVNIIKIILILSMNFISKYLEYFEVKFFPRILMNFHLFLLELNKLMNRIG